MSPEEAVPAYDDHTSDEQYQATNSPWNYRSDLEQSSIEARGSRSLALDRDLIFPTTVPYPALYSLYHTPKR
jgi:hypothetical protein